MASKLITELLDEINKDPSVITKHAGNGALRLLFEHAFDPAKKFNLPEGAPPYKEDAAPIGMSPGNLHMEMRKLYIYCRTDLTAIRRETLFVQLLEGIHPSEAKLVLAVKDQELTKMYPKITHKLVHDAGMVAVAPTAKKEKAPKKEQAPKSGADQS
jgi:hypothetical protein